MKDVKINRNYGYDILINTFEAFLRDYIANEIFLPNYGGDWKNHIPKGVFEDISKFRGESLPDDYSIDNFFEELSFTNLKDIMVFSNHFILSKSFFGELSKDKFIELMDDLNIFRRKIAHAKSAFSDIDLQDVIEKVKLLVQGEEDIPREITKYLENESYKKAQNVPLNFFEEYECQNNLPSENYDIDGGFVGRDKEIQAISKLIKSDQDRIITITGAGGVGKTAIALKITYSFLSDPQNLFDAIIWFSAKTDKLTEKGIVPLESEIRSDEQLIYNILTIVDPDTLEKFKNAKVSLDSYKAHLFNIFSSQKCLLVIDNLETIIKNDNLINFIKNVPRPSQVLITSRKGLGEIERRYPLFDMLERDALRLFRIIAHNRNRQDLLRMKNETIAELVNRVKCYPLLIKWSIGKICLGKNINEAFGEIFAGDSEIAKFSFNDVFSLLSSNEKNILFSMIIFGDKPISRSLLMHLVNITEEQFEDAIEELIVTSFVIPENKETGSELITEYTMLALTRGFVAIKLDDDQKAKNMLQTRYYHLSKQIEEYEKSQSSYSQSLFSLGIKSPEEQVAFNYVKAAKTHYQNNDLENTRKAYEQAVKIAPNFVYVMIEYSKFEFNIRHIPQALQIAKRTTEIHGENYHAWFNYGMMLKKNNDIDLAINALEKAKEINPNHLPIYNELGRAYTFRGYYERADLEFKNALRDEKYPNYRHKLFTLQFYADNYRRWAQSFILRMDYEGAIEKLKNAYDIIQKVIEDYGKTDRRLWDLYWRICIDLGKAVTKEKGFDAGKIYFEECIQPVSFGAVPIAISRNIVAEACHYLIIFSTAQKDVNIKQIETWISICENSCSMNTEIARDVSNAKERLKNERGRESGIIKWFNSAKKFGIIEIKDKTYTFVRSGFRDKIPMTDLDALDNKPISCMLINHPDKASQIIATDITFDKI